LDFFDPANPAGLPFNPEFAITHITELPSRAAADEVLRAGPTSWGTVLQLPDSWVQAVSTAQLPEEQPLSTALEVRLSLVTQADMLLL
jgi:hypothetical protein